MTAASIPGVAVVAEAARTAALTHELGLVEMQAVDAPCAPLFERAYRGALLGVVAKRSALPAAAVAGLVFRLPWVAVLDHDEVEAVASSRVQRAALRRTAAVVAPAATREAVLQAHPHARFVEREDVARVRTVLQDVALPREARAAGGGAVGPVAVGVWLFVDDRLTRLAIRLVKATGKAPDPIHPHHLLRGSEHRWYAGAIRSGDRVLDVGCANGAIAFDVARTAAEVIGVDIDASEIERARERAARGGVSNLRFDTGDLTDAATLRRFEPESFDVALVLDVLEHLVDRVALLRAVRRLLKPSGQLIVAVPNVETDYKHWRARHGGVIYANPDHKVEYTEARIHGELERAGFAIERFEYGGFDTPLHGLGALLGALSVPLYRSLTERRHRIGQRDSSKASAFRIVATPTQRPVGGRPPLGSAGR